jgi:hypothetical protein
MEVQTGCDRLPATLGVSSDGGQPDPASEVRAPMPPALPGREHIPGLECDSRSSTSSSIRNGAGARCGRWPWSSAAPSSTYRRLRAGRRLWRGWPADHGSGRLGAPADRRGHPTASHTVRGHDHHHTIHQPRPTVPRPHHLSDRADTLSHDRFKIREREPQNNNLSPTTTPLEALQPDTPELRKPALWGHTQPRFLRPDDPDAELTTRETPRQREPPRPPRACRLGRLSRARPSPPR